MIQAIGKHKVVLVTGPSGAGRASAINVLEDLGYEAIDNLPLRLVPRLLDGPPAGIPLALGIDVRNRDFSTAGLLETVDQLSQRSDVSLTMLYLDCRADVLLRRFSETRRRHPLSPADSPGRGIDDELDLLMPIRELADSLVDTSDLNVHQLKTEMERRFKPDSRFGLAISVESFSYKRGLPRGVDMIFDCRFLRNPYWERDLRSKNGLDADVAAHVAGDPRFQDFYNQVLNLTRSLLPAYIDEGKSHFSIGFGCTGGQHRSVALTQALAKALAEDGRQVSTRHRELERRKQGETPA